jgi:hypothetical protein
MTEPDALRELQRELDRVVDRLNSMPLGRAEGTAADCQRAALVIVEQTRLITDEIPVDATVPELGPHGLGSMLAVLGSDYLAAARQSANADVSAVTAALVDLRRALP